MNEWNDLGVKMPAEDEAVEIELPGGRRIKPVLFAKGRFWKVRKGLGGQAYPVVAWRAIEAPKKSERAKKGDVDGSA